jgi:hypothetical protein
MAKAKKKAKKVKAKLTTIYHISTCIWGEQDWFFDADGKLLAQWDRNDADYRHEYMGPLFRKLGYEVKVVTNERDPRFYPAIKEELIAYGASEEDLKETDDYDYGDSGVGDCTDVG